MIFGFFCPNDAPTQKSHTARPQTVSAKTTAKPTNQEVGIWRIAESYRMLNYPAKAEPYYRQALEIGADKFPQAAYYLGTMLRALERYEEAVASCNKALIIQPTDNQAWLFRGAALNHLGRYKQSYDSYDKALGIERQSIGQKLLQMFKGIFKLGNSSNTTLVIRNL